MDFGGEFMKRIVILFVLAAIVVSLLLLMLLPLKRQNSKQMIKAIQQSDYTLLTELVEKSPEAALQSPNASPNWWLVLMDTPAYDVFPPFHRACYQGDLEAVQIILAVGISVNHPDSYGNYSPLMACMISDSNQKTYIANLLLDNGADPFVKCELNIYPDALCQSICLLQDMTGSEQEKEVALFERILQMASPETYDFGEALNTAVVLNNSYATRRILEFASVSVNSPLVVNGYVWAASLLHRAVERNASLEYIQFLLSIGADKTLTDKNGKTAYDYAIENGYTELAELLKP